MCVCVCLCVCVWPKPPRASFISYYGYDTSNTPLTFLGWAAKYFYEKIFSRIITKSNYLFLAALGLCCCAQAFSSCSEQRLLSSCSVWGLCRGSFSCCGTWVLEPGLQLLQLTGSVTLRHVGSSQIRDPTGVPYNGRPILNHWTTREVPSSKVLK